MDHRASGSQLRKWVVDHRASGSQLILKIAAGSPTTTVQDLLNFTHCDYTILSSSSYSSSKLYFLYLFLVRNRISCTFFPYEIVFLVSFSGSKSSLLSTEIRNAVWHQLLYFSHCDALSEFQVVFLRVWSTKQGVKTHTHKKKLLEKRKTHTHKHHLHKGDPCEYEIVRTTFVSHSCNSEEIQNELGSGPAPVSTKTYCVPTRKGKHTHKSPLRVILIIGELFSP